MYDEENVVQHNVDEIKKHYGDESVVIVVQSDSGQKIKGADIFKVLPNLEGTVDSYKLPAYAVVRNYNTAFHLLYSKYINVKYVVALTGDTYISDITAFDRLYLKMNNAKKNICVSQAIGQNFHAANANPPEIVEGRYQHDGISDFMPQFFLIDGRFAYETLIFATTMLTNEYCTEQCLGDELLIYMADLFETDVYVLAKNAYDYNDGIIYNKND